MGGKLKALFAQTDMTVGKPWKQIVIFTIPMLIGNIAQQLYNTVDSIVVGKYVGDNALAAVGSASPILNLLLVLFIGISMGTSIMVSQFFGAKDREHLSKTIGSTITLTAAASLIIMVFGSVTIRPLLKMLNTPASIIDWCTSYLLIATVINIILDLWFVAGLQMGVAGVALATVIAQMVSAVLCFFKLKRMTDVFDLKFQYLKPDMENIMTILRLGLPSGITQAIFSMAMVVVQSLTNSFGEMVIAANVIIMRVDGFAMMPNFSFGTAMTTYSGQNVGAKEIERVHKGAKQGTMIAAGTSAVITALILIFGKYLMGIFTNTSELVALSANMMKILAVGYIAMAVTQSLSGVMRGAGDTMTPMWISIVTTVFIRVPLAYGIAYFTKTPELPGGRYECIWVSLLISWVLGAVLTVIFYRIGKWKNKGLES